MTSDNIDATALAENEKYRFYSCGFSMLRENIKDGEVVYFGGSATVGSIYHNKLYWYSSGFISDRFIFRCNVEDGLNKQKFDWVSNEKTIEVVLNSAHCVSEDRVISMTVQDNCLVIVVKRISIPNGKYALIITEEGQKIEVSKHIISGDFSESKDCDTFTKLESHDILDMKFF